METEVVVEEEEKTLKAALETAREEEGETDILDAYFALASFYSKIGDKDTAVTTFDEILKLGKLSSQKKLEALMGKVSLRRTTSSCSHYHRHFI